MSGLRRSRTTFHRLALSYAALVAAVAALVGGISFALYSSNYATEVRKVRTDMLAYLARTLDDRVFGAAQKIYLDLTIASGAGPDLAYFSDHPVRGNHARLFEIYGRLNDLAQAGFPVVDAVHVYVAAIDTLISTSMGLKYLGDTGREAYARLPWLAVPSPVGAAERWIETREVPVDVERDGETRSLLTYVRSLPFSRSDRPPQGIVAVDVEERVVRETIRDALPEYADGILVVNRAGVVISHPDPASLYADLAGTPYVRRILADGAGGGSFVEKIDGVRSMVTWKTLGCDGWFLLDRTSVSDFFARAARIQRAVVLVVVAAVAVGLLVARILTTRMYDPLRRLMERVGRLGAEAGRLREPGTDEYAVIDRTLNTLAVKVDELEATLAHNRPILKHNLVTGLLLGRIATRDALADTLRLLKLAMDYRAYAPILVRLGGMHEAEADVGRRQFVLYRLVESVESGSDAKALFLGAVVSDVEIAAVACLAQPSPARAAEAAERIARYARETFSLGAVAVLGRARTDPLELHATWAEVLRAAAYVFFLPGTAVVRVDEVLSRESSARKVPERLFEELSRALNTRAADAAERTASSIVARMKEGGCSADRCRQGMDAMIALLARYAAAQRFGDGSAGADGADADADPEAWIRGACGRAADVDAFRDAYVACVATVIDHAARRAASRGPSVVAAVKDHVDRHPGDELTLDLLADMTKLTPGYLSRLFKDETGVNLTDYVTTRRLAYARDLLATTVLSVSEVGIKAGYHSTAYFIRKFREAYGETPRGFRRASRPEADAARP